MRPLLCRMSAPRSSFPGRVRTRAPHRRSGTSCRAARSAPRHCTPTRRWGTSLSHTSRRSRRVHTRAPRTRACRRPATAPRPVTHTPCTRRIATHRRRRSARPRRHRRRRTPAWLPERTRASRRQPPRPQPRPGRHSCPCTPTEGHHSPRWRTQTATETPRTPSCDPPGADRPRRARL